MSAGIDLRNKKADKNDILVRLVVSYVSYRLVLLVSWLQVSFIHLNSHHPVLPAAVAAAGVPVPVENQLNVVIRDLQGFQP